MIDFRVDLSKFLDTLVLNQVHIALFMHHHMFGHHIIADKGIQWRWREFESPFDEFEAFLELLCMASGEISWASVELVKKKASNMICKQLWEKLPWVQQNLVNFGQDWP